MKIIGIIGSRRRNTETDLRLVETALLSVHEDGDQIVSGGCPRGGDRFAEILAKRFDIPIIVHRPDWAKGRFAGYARNGAIAYDADVLIACVAPDRRGGTEDTIRKFDKMGKTRLILV